MRSNERWRNNWLAAGRPGAVPVRIGRRRSSRREAAETVARLDEGAHVVLLASAPGAARRCRRFAASAGIAIEREFLAFPSAQSPAYLVEDSVAPVRFFVNTVLVTPPRTRLAVVVDAGLAVGRAVGGGRLVRMLAPGRVFAGSRA